MKNYIIKNLCISFIIFLLIFTTGCVNNEKQIETSVTTPIVSQTQEIQTSKETTQTTTKETTPEQKTETTVDETTQITTTQEQTTATTQTAPQETTSQTTTQETTTQAQTVSETQAQTQSMYDYDLSELCVKDLFTSANLPDRISTVEDVINLRVYAISTGKTEIETYISTFEENVLNHIYSDALINGLEIQYIDTEHLAKFLITYSEEYRIYQAILSKNTSNLTSKELKVYNKVHEIINSVVDINDSDYNNAKALHDYIINTTRYANTDDDKTSYGTLINGQAVCTGYSEAYWLLCNASGIRCHNISGSAGGENHQWNIICIDGKWLYTDVTWDDPISNSGDILTYDYFAKSENLCNHTFDDINLRL